MYGRADGMPSFQLTVAVRGRIAASCVSVVLMVSYLAPGKYFAQRNSPRHGNLCLDYDF